LPTQASQRLETKEDMDIVDSQLLRPVDVIELLGVSRSWLYEAAKSGRIPCVRLGGPDGPVRFRARELEAWIEQSRVTRNASLPPASHEEPAARTGDPPVRADVAQLRLLSDGSG
jgi:excisionase family DNA binding protein